MGTGFVIVAAALIAAAEVGGADGEPRAPRHWPTDGIPVGGFTSKLSDDPKVMQERIVALQDVGLSYAYVVAHRSSKSLTVSLEVADRLGFALVPHMDTYVALLSNPTSRDSKLPLPRPGYKGTINVGETDWAQRYASGELVYCTWGDGYPYADPLAPVARRAMRSVVCEMADTMKGHPAGRLISYDDEYYMWYDYTGKGMPIYSPWAYQTMRALAGYSGRQLDYHRKPGYVADGKDPFVAVRHTLGYQYGSDSISLGFHAQDLSQVLHARAPGIRDFTTPGAVRGETDVAMIELYDSLYNTAVLTDAFHCDRARARTTADHPLYVLIGWWADQPPELQYMARRISTAARLAMLRGAQSVCLAPVKQMLANAPWKAQVIRAGEDARLYGPLLRKLKLQPSRVGLLWSDVTLSHQQSMDWPKVREAAKQGKHFETPWEHLHAVGELSYAALCCAGLPPRVITERGVLDGVLSELDVLVMVNHQYSETRLMRRYDQFVQRGGVILADPTSSVIPKGAKIVDYDANAWTRHIEAGDRIHNGKDAAKYTATHRLMRGLIMGAAPKLRQALAPYVRDRTFQMETSGPIVPYEARAAGCRYLLAINTDVLDKAEQTLRFRHDGVVYDLTAGGKTVKLGEAIDGFRQAKLALGPGEWAIWMLADRPIERLGALVATRSGPFAVRCTAWDDEGFPLGGAVPFCVKTPTGKQWGAMEHGMGAAWIWSGLKLDEEVSVECLGATVKAEWIDDPGHAAQQTQGAAETITTP